MVDGGWRMTTLGVIVKIVVFVLLVWAAVEVYITVSEWWRI
jgi:hypothetical protein